MRKLYGLVVCGGRSSRMNRDKSLLDYHGEPQRFYVYNLLKSFCDKVFISCNGEQARQIPTSYHFITDNTRFEHIGPMAALLSAFEAFPDASFIAIGCDYPFVRKEDFKALINSRRQNALAVSFYNEASGIVEPLLAIYENGLFDLMKKNFLRKKYSLRYLLEEVNAIKITPTMPAITISIDTHQEYQRVLKDISNYKTHGA